MRPEEKHSLQAQAERVSLLIFKYLQNTLTEAEDEELSSWIKQNEQNWKIFEEFTGETFKKRIFNQ